MSRARFWKVHFEKDGFGHWVSIDCGQRVEEPEAVRLAEKAIPHRGPITNAIQDFERSDYPETRVNH